MAWSATQYTKFESERTRPVRDLLAAVPTGNPARLADLGCGPGNSTEVLHARHPDARLTAMGSCADMLEAARKRLPDVDFLQADIGTWGPDEQSDLTRD